MPKLFMPELSSPELRRRALEDTCDRAEKTTYMKSLEQNEVDIRMETLTKNIIALDGLEDEKKAFMEEMKASISPLKEENKALLRELKTRQAEVSGTLYYMADYDSGMMEIYDDSGAMVNSRRLRPEERQGTIHSLNRKIS